MKRKRLWNVALVVAAVGAGLLLSARPWRVASEQRRRAEEAQAQMRESERHRVELIREKARLEAPIGREALAREKGFVKPDEAPAVTR
ncbi:MAG: hypothetical protein HYR64_07095 [Fimbriimonas ginsengisoli]|uniref:Septum formation initiator family protein n=1 Tax=Fimbriimonas ginsengisoli TaxID=1005039 RepID=A0A931PW25_FIMGI|nr:hypothetical protein [Fimbriimonas ginsengisoli]